MASASVTALLLICTGHRPPQADTGSLENPPRDLAAHVLIEMYLPDSVDRTPQPRIGDRAMFVVWPVG